MEPLRSVNDTVLINTTPLPYFSTLNVDVFDSFGNYLDSKDGFQFIDLYPPLIDQESIDAHFYENHPKPINSTV